MLRNPSRVLLLAMVIVLCSRAAGAEGIEGFTVTGQFREQVHVFKFDPGVTATVVAPPVRDFESTLRLAAAHA